MAASSAVLAPRVANAGGVDPALSSGGSVLQVAPYSCEPAPWVADCWRGDQVLHQLGRCSRWPRQLRAGAQGGHR
ncbi:hypothetical protein, partial [Aeromonas caviae]|uniref:hypothetical protein n=1 Tax=Aeromonas caviae TaxID=648 RepID=UPI003EC852A9